MDEPTNIPPPPASRGFQLNGPTVVGLLYVATYFTMFTALVGLILAYVWKREAGEEWARSHYSYLIRTFWLGVLGIVGGALLGVAAAWMLGDRAGQAGEFSPILFIPLGLLLVLLAVLLLVRCVLSLVNAQQNLPMPKPESWTI